MGKHKQRRKSMTINIGGGELKELKPRILVLGIGGAGGNAVNAMIDAGMELSDEDESDDVVPSQDTRRMI